MTVRRAVAIYYAWSAGAFAAALVLSALLDTQSPALALTFLIAVKPYLRMAGLVARQVLEGQS